MSESMMSMENQLIYRLGSLESKLDAGFHRLDEKFDRMQTEMHERTTETTKDFADFRTATNVEIAALNTKVATLEKWQTSIIAYGLAALAAVTIFWTIFGPWIRYLVGIPNG